ncbi:hypothetical protein [Luteibacter sp. Lutesp34]|uniref:BP74-related protein n=1 Tax=Luteibacter sp. Lutesp34 TaxID=3243030 RepID=UPI0039B376EB
MSTLPKLRLATRVTLALAVLTGTAAYATANTDASSAEPRYFAFGMAVGEPTIDPNEFIIEVRDPALAERYTDIVRGNERQPGVAFFGNVVPERAPYNEGWAFHVDPASLLPPSQTAIEVCDATPQFIEGHLAEVGGATLPGGNWCPWSMRVLREVKR